MLRSGREVAWMDECSRVAEVNPKYMPVPRSHEPKRSGGHNSIDVKHIDAGATPPVLKLFRHLPGANMSNSIGGCAVDWLKSAAVCQYLRSGSVGRPVC